MWSLIEFFEEAEWKGTGLAVPYLIGPLFQTQQTSQFRMRQIVATPL
jgi:hypothetical protein